jgi:hypothetical protein
MLRSPVRSRRGTPSAKLACEHLEDRRVLSNGLGLGLASATLLPTNGLLAVPTPTAVASLLTSAAAPLSHLLPNHLGALFGELIEDTAALADASPPGKHASKVATKPKHHGAAKALNPSAADQPWLPAVATAPATNPKAGQNLKQAQGPVVPPRPPWPTAATQPLARESEPGTGETAPQGPGEAAYPEAINRSPERTADGLPVAELNQSPSARSEPPPTGVDRVQEEGLQEKRGRERDRLKAVLPADQDGAPVVTPLVESAAAVSPGRGAETVPLVEELHCPLQGMLPGGAAAWGLGLVGFFAVPAGDVAEPEAGPAHGPGGAEQQGDESVEAPPPQPAGLVTGAPANMATLHRAVQEFLSGLDDLGRGLAEAMATQPAAAWAVAVALGAAAVGAGRYRRRKNGYTDRCHESPSQAWLSGSCPFIAEPA